MARKHNQQPPVHEHVDAPADDDDRDFAIYKSYDVDDLTELVRVAVDHARATNIPSGDFLVIPHTKPGFVTLVIGQRL